MTAQHLIVQHSSEHCTCAFSFRISGHHNQLNLTLECMRHIAGLSQANSMEKAQLIDAFKKHIELKIQ